MQFVLRGPDTLTERLFRHIRVDQAWERAVRSAAERGPVVYVLRNVSLLDLLALDYLTRHLRLPRIGYANDHGAFVGPWLTGIGRGSAAERLRSTIEAGGSAALFMKRPPSVLGGGTHRGRIDGDEPLRVLLEMQRAGAREIVLMPQTFVWTQRPERLRFSLVDTLFGPADFPGELRQVGQFLFNYKGGVLRAGEALSLREFLAAAGGDADVRRLTYALLRKLERERRAILGLA